MVEKTTIANKIEGESMKHWIVPTVCSFFLWGIWGFLPKLTVLYINPKSAVIYEALGGMILVCIMLILPGFRPEIHPKGIALALTTGLVGFCGALFFLMAVARGPITLVVTLSALYPVISILLAMVILHESITIRQGIGIALALCSIVLIAR